MSPALIALGVILLTSAVRGTHSQLFELWGEEFTGDGQRPGFGPMALAVGVSASIGYVPGLRAASNGLTALVIFAIVAANLRQDNPFTRLSDFVVRPGAGSGTPNAAGVTPITPTTPLQPQGATP